MTESKSFARSPSVAHAPHATAQRHAGGGPAAVLTRRRRLIRRAAGFTLTEVLISLAMVALLLVGISRIFALTSATIGTGQALSTSLRGQRAIQQVLSQDFLGAGELRADMTRGMAPLVSTYGLRNGAPFLAITNFRVATYLNESAARADIVGPTDADDFETRSTRIRGVDLNNDGQELAADNEITPIYAYGERNFRCDTIGFFAGGEYQSFANPGATSKEAFVWYGHLRVFNGTPAQLGYSNAYGAPGERLTPNLASGPVPGQLPNRNNLFAEQFMLGRYQAVLIDRTDHDGDEYLGNTNPSDRTVVENNDPTKPVPFARPVWDDIGEVNESQSASPFNFGTPIVRFNPDPRIRENQVLDAKGQPGGNALPRMNIDGSRNDILGVSMATMRDRSRALDKFDKSKRQTTKPPPNWGASLPITHTERFRVNPFVTASDDGAGNTTGLDLTSVAQRQQLLAAGCSQFIVEFAGDFVKQEMATGNDFGKVTDQVPDGILDFVALTNDTAGTRWYGLPRDVNGDGVIPGWGNNDNIRISPDVIPLRDVADVLPEPEEVNRGYYKVKERRVEVRVPPIEKAPNANYAAIVEEPGMSVNISGYACVWTINEFENDDPDGSHRYAVPQLIRIVAELRDEQGKLKEPIVQEFTFPVPRSAPPPTTP